MTTEAIILAWIAVVVTIQFIMVFGLVYIAYTFIQGLREARDDFLDLTPAEIKQMNQIDEGDVPDFEGQDVFKGDFDEE